MPQNGKTSASGLMSSVIYRREFCDSRSSNIRITGNIKESDMVGVVRTESEEYTITDALLPNVEIMWRVITSHGIIYYDGFADYFYSTTEIDIDALTRSQISATVVDKLLEIAGSDSIRIVRPNSDDEIVNLPHRRRHRQAHPCQ